MEATTTLNRRQRRLSLNKLRKKNNHKVGGKKVQPIWSEPHKILIGSYTTKSGQVKNRYKINPNAKIVKIIIQQ
jgi:hypothetical protein